MDIRSEILLYGDALALAAVRRWVAVGISHKYTVAKFRRHPIRRRVTFSSALESVSARLYESTGRAIAVTPASVSALASASALLKC